MLIASGFTKVEIDESMNNVKKYRHQRLISFALQDFDNFYLFIESAKRKLHRLRKRVSKQKEQGLSWENTRISKSL
jgi:DNA transposition AAA+ family ATPase